MEDFNSTPVHSDERSWLQRNRESLGVTFCSLALHVSMLAILAMIILPDRSYDVTQYLTVRTEVIDQTPLETVDNIEITPEKLTDSDFNNSAALAIPTNVVSVSPSAVTVDTEQEKLQWKADALEYLGKTHEFGELSGRTDEARSILLKAFGGNATSEAAVASGLQWLTKHQNKDGSWNFDHRRESCGDSCTSAGSLKNNPVAATSMALLCFVGAGHTHETGKYQDQVKNGLEFLATKFFEADTQGDMRGLDYGNSGMYSQGITTIVLSELYGLTRDRRIRTMAQACVDFTIDAQHPENGGWRYRIQQADGDTSVVGWQVMAMTSAQMAGLNVPGRVKVRAERFLDTVQLAEGAYYGYVRPEKKASTTAIGLLCRMYYGWETNHPAIKAGVDFLSEVGPAADNQYYNYYATQVLHHYGGTKWDRWNDIMREQIVSAQAKDGHAAGSWAPRDPHGATGGRHYATCLSILTLEVYYRHLPLYRRRFIQAEL